MELSEDVKQKIHEAHFVRGIPPSEYLVKYRSMFELLEYRSHLQPDDVYIVYYPEAEEKIQLTYKEFIAKAFKTANLLRSSGIKTEDRIATVSHNHLNTIIQYFAAWSLGATVVPINVNEELQRIKYILESSGTKFAFVNSIYLGKILQIQKSLPALNKIFVYGNHAKDFNLTSGVTIENYESAMESQPDKFQPDENVRPETESLIVYTSGTTGLPKGVVLTQYNLLADADGITKWHKMEKGQAMMCVLPIHHVNGTVVTHITPMYFGGKVVLSQKFHTRTFFERLAKEKVQVVSVVPTLLQFLCHDYETGDSADGGKDFFHVYEEQLSANFRHIICGAGPLTCELALKFENMFGLEIMHGYGLSETTCYSCFLPVTLSDEEHTMWLGEFGFPSIGVEIEPNEMDIHNSSGEPVPEGERGEIVIRGHNVMKYYDANPDANARTFEFSWFRSGDEGFYKKDTQGRKYFFITGRIKELIIRGGVNIAPLEIDEVLMSLPEVKAGIAVGFENDWYGEEVGALVLLKDDALSQKTEDEVKSSIIKQCREKLPLFKSPKVVVLSDTIPVTSTGKYQRNKVKHLFEEFKKIQFK
jgi:acyl-CoA synthetase (AMP-forming)/AMP-acid ligase II